jgi:hypothetical protein
VPIFNLDSVLFGRSDNPPREHLPRAQESRQQPHPSENLKEKLVSTWLAAAASHANVKYNPRADFFYP